MTRKLQVVLQDDINGGPADETVRFGLDGVDYEIDLTEENATSLREMLSRWIRSARRASIRIPEPRHGGVGRGADPADIRRWATEQGIPVSARGRLSIDLRERFEAAH